MLGNVPGEVSPDPLSTGIPIAAASAGAAQNARSIIRSPTDSQRRIAARLQRSIIASPTLVT
jgi:hypothetical protein